MPNQRASEKVVPGITRETKQEFLLIMAAEELSSD
jgi:hypothetical protein